MSAEGFEIQVGRRYKGGEGYYVIPSDVGEEEVLFDKFRPNGTQWGTDRMTLGSFRHCYAPIAPDLLKEAVEHIIGLVRAYRCMTKKNAYYFDYRVDVINSAEAFLAQHGPKGIK